jgi:lipopolysaccharide transport system ATP-binding protein
MKRKEIDAKFDAIVDFSGTEKFLDTPLKHFSSGMQLRLAFAVAAFLEPEILVIDEVLAVGDAEFQKKCMGKMQDVSNSGRTILFVSHNLAAVENLCSRALLLNQGTVVKDATTTEIIRHYQSTFSSLDTNRYVAEARNEDAYFETVEIELSGKQPVLTLKVKCEIASNRSHKDAFLAFDISNSMGVPIMQAIPVLESFIRYSPTSQSYEVEIDLPPLIPDIYRVSAWLGSHNTETICWLKEIVKFEIET